MLEQNEKSGIEIYLEKLKASKELHNGFALSSTQRDLVKVYFAEHSENVKIKKHTMLPNAESLMRSVIKDAHGGLWALLPHTDEIPQGIQATVKVAQNMETGEFCLAKITRLRRPLKAGEKEKKQNEAQAETRHLDTRGLLLGTQYRDRFFRKKKDVYKHYNFMKVLPGISLSKLFIETQRAPLTPLEQCTFFLSLLKKLEELRRDSIIHQDLHGENILVHPASLECHIIDFGFAVTADKEGFWYKESSDGKITFRRANGMDIESALDLIRIFVITDDTLKQLLESLYARVGNGVYPRNSFHQAEYNSIDLSPTIQAVVDYQAQLLEGDTALESIPAVS